MRVHADLPPPVDGPASNKTHRREYSSTLTRRSTLWSSISSAKSFNHRLLVSPFVFACCWWFIAVMHFFNGTLVLAFSILYLFFSLPTVYPTVAVVEISLTVMKISGWAYFFIAVVHWLALFRMVRRSLQYRGLTFSTSTKRIASAKNSLSCLSLCFETIDRLQQIFWKPWNRLFGVEGIFGVNGQHFYVAFLTREVVEVGLQSYQAYQLSRSVRRPWITNLAVITIMLNSISTPFVHAMLRRQQESARRFMSLLVDMSLDFCCAAVIPVCVVFPYISTYDISIGSMPRTIINDDVQFASSLIEIRQFCVTSGLDFFATMMPQLTVFTCLNLAQKIVRRDTSAGTRTTVSEKRMLRTRISMAIIVLPEASAVSSLIPPRTSHSTTLGRLHSAFHFLVFVWSAIILSVHVRASTNAEASVVPGCRLSLNAWFAVGTPCSVMQINCYRLGLEGSAEEMTRMLRPLDRELLRKLIITHCSSLEIPMFLTGFSGMTDLDIYNSTLVSWPTEAAATPATMKSLVNFNWFRSPFIAFPAGLLHSNLPKGFSRFSIARSNASELPPNLGTLWTDTTLDVFSLQFTHISRLPSSFSELRAHKIRLISNCLDLIDDDAFATKTLTSLHLSGNPLHSLPTSIGDTTKLLEIRAEYTRIRNVSAQVAAWWARPPTGLLAHHTFSMYGSPACDDLSDAAFCRRDYGNANGTYLWDLLEPQRAIDK